MTVTLLTQEKPTLKSLLPKWLQGETEAIAFILAIHEIVELWDDLIDGDSVTASDINAAFYGALVSLPRNQFYVQNFDLLSPIIESAIFDWWAANALEAKGGEHLHSSYMLRCAGLSLTVMSARIIGGVEWAANVNAELRTLGDTWAEYAARHGVK